MHSIHDQQTNSHLTFMSVMIASYCQAIDANYNPFNLIVLKINILAKTNMTLPGAHFASCTKVTMLYSCTL